MSANGDRESAAKAGRSTAKKDRRAGAARVQRPNRFQAVFRPETLDEVLPADHRARTVWAMVEKLDLSAFYERIASREAGPGRPAIDPRILVSLWVYATAEGVGKARQLERLCEQHDAYRWICGGVSVNYHTLSDFRVGRGKELDALMTQILGLLMSEGLVQLRRVAQDGTRVRASAGASSFRRERSLKKCLREAEERVARLKKEVAGEEDPTTDRRRKAARDRAARERKERVERALAKLPEARASKRPPKRDEARVSTTDPEARVMKMGDGGFRPAVNMQFAVDTESRVVVGAGVTSSGSDKLQMQPMLEQIEQRTGRLPDEMLVDGGYTNHDAIRDATTRGVTVFTPPQARLEDPHEPQPNDSPEVAEWRVRMGTADAKATYKDRASTVETLNGDLRAHRGLDQLRVRGLDKALTIALWAAITTNLLRWAVLAADC